MNPELERVIDDYATWLRSWGAAKTTVHARTTLARSRIAEWGLAGFTPENVTAFLARPELKSAWSRSTYHTHLTDLCAWLYGAGHIAADPMPDVRTPQRGSKTPRPLSEPEVARVLEAAKGRTRDWIMLALLAGLRASEVARMHGHDVTPDGIYVRGKGGSVVTLPCHDDLWAMAQRYPRDGYWFPGTDDGHIRPQRISLTVGRLFDSLDIDGSIHRCRHVYGTRLLRLPQMHIRTVQKLMRHANLDTTANYTAVDEDEMRSAINMLPSLDPLPPSAA